MNGNRLFNFILYPVVTTMGWLMTFGIIPGVVAIGLFIGIAAPSVFTLVYLPIFRRKGWTTFTEIFGEEPK